MAENLDGVLQEFDKVIGLCRLKAFHLNDSLNERGSRQDRHALLGEGKIGMKALMNIVAHPRLCSLPFILETPTDTAGHAAEIQRVKELLGEYGL